MPRVTTRVPKYRLHKPSGLAVVRLNGKDIYLGRHGSPESQAEYRRVIAEWMLSTTATTPGAGRRQAESCIVNELALAYLRHAKAYYVKNGRPTGELRNIKDAIRPLVQSHGHVHVSAFGPLALKAVRQTMVDADLSRKVVNSRVNRLRRVFKWGVENELVLAAVLHGLQAVAPLKRGRCQVRETAPVQPVPDGLIDPVLRVAPAQIGAMIELQRLTGMRPCEVVLMRTTDVDTTGPIWSYTPAEHKTEHHDRKRMIYLGPQAQRILRPHLKKDLQAFIFDPREVMADRWADKRRARRTPMTPSQAARKRKRNPHRAPQDRYTTMSYARAIAYACDQAFPHPLLATTRYAHLEPHQRQQVDVWRREHRWSPNRLRHNAATFLRKQFGIEAARVVLGHSSADVTEIYAERDLSKAAEIMGRVG
ncbi:MAG TPA: site-specific integrase [Phycisphaerales bacterium]|nr:site-specific integrase [Phycisphaerales bacterium]